MKLLGALLNFVVFFVLVLPFVFVLKFRKHVIKFCVKTLHALSRINNYLCECSKSVCLLWIISFWFFIFIRYFRVFPPFFVCVCLLIVFLRFTSTNSWRRDFANLVRGIMLLFPPFWHSCTAFELLTPVIARAEFVILSLQLERVRVLAATSSLFCFIIPLLCCLYGFAIVIWEWFDAPLNSDNTSCYTGTQYPVYCTLIP